MPGSCFSDPEKLTKVCADDKKLTIDMTDKGRSEIDKAIQSVGKDPNIAPDEKQYYTNMLQNAKGSQVTINDADIIATTCVTDPQTHTDQLILVHGPNALLEGKFSAPVKPVNMKQGECKKVVNNSPFLHNKYQHEEQAVSTLQNVVRHVNIEKQKQSFDRRTLRAPPAPKK